MMRQRNRLGTFAAGAWLSAPALGALAASLLLASSSVAVAQPAEPPAEPGTGKPLQGKGFDINKFENSLWSPEKKKTELAKSEARKTKIAKLLELANDPTYQNKADALFRLAETHWQESKFQYFMEREKYEAAMQCFEEKRCADEPQEPVEDQTTAIDWYQKVLLASPNYERLDQVTYFLGRAKIESGKSKNDRQMQLDGEKYLKDVTTKWPKSSYVPEAHLTLAEYYFEKDSLFYAKTNYEAIIQKFPDHGMFNYALYKLGWVYFNLAEFEKTIETFHKVIGSMKGREDKGLIQFREQALNDLIQAYAEVDNGWREARDYFKKEVGEKDTYDKLDKMAALLVTKDKDEEAVELYKHLIEHDKVNPRIAEYYDAVLEVRRKIADMKETEAEINEIAAFFDPKGAWFTANKNDTPVVEKAHELVSGNLAFMANYYHREAQASEDKKKMADSAKQYDSAVSYYSRFLERYPDHPDSYKFNFFYAEILYDRGKYMEASEQYEKTLQKDTKGEFVEDAALGVVYAIDKELCRTGKRQCAEGKNVEVTKVEIDTSLSGQKDEEIKQTPLDPLEERMIGAADKYVKVLGQNLKDPEFVKKFPNRGQKIPNMMYVAAEMFFRHGQFRESVTRLQVIFDLFPKDEMASYAVNLIIDAYKRLKNWVQIEKWAREVIEKKNFTTRKKEDWEQIIAISKTEYAKELTLQRRFDEAVKVQQEIVEEFGRKNPDVASKALFNVGAIHEIARRFPEAITAYGEVIKAYKDREVAVQAQAAIGILYESQTEFAKAAEAFVGMQQFKSSFAKNPAAAQRAADAYRDAGVLYLALEEYDKATEVFEQYTKMYGNRPDVARVAFEAALSQEYKNTPEGFERAGKLFEKFAKTYGRKDGQYDLRATAAAGLAYKKADKVKNRKKVEGLFRSVAKSWEKLDKAVAAGKAEAGAETKYYAAIATFELAEYAYDDYSKLTVDAINRQGGFDMGLLKRTLTAKAEALQAAEKAFDKVLLFKDKGMAAAAAFRLGQLFYEFAESLFNAPVPPGLTPDQVDEYRFALEEFATPIQEKALAAFTAALKQAVQDGVYNKWSRLSATYAARVNKDEFPIAEFAVQPDKTRDTVLSTSFIKAVRRGSIVVDYLKQTSTDTKTEGQDDKKTDAPNPGQ
ncbi:MAG: tetratricopeptide repeat protein [Deltaproteobacteria bacterium]|nr:tetratricopeptide repeat protein [Deltaproteobacteria bacterium]